MANITFMEASGVADSVFGKSQAPIRMFVEKKAEAFEQNSMLPHIFTMGTSKHWAEKFTSMTGMDGFQPVGENGEYPVDGQQESFSKTMEHMVWKDSFNISREIIDDGVTMELKKKPAGFVTGYYRTRERFGSALYAAAINKKTVVAFMGKNFATTGADNKCVFATDHPSILKKGTQSNQFADAFSVDALSAAETEMQNFKGDNGEILAVTPNTIMIPNDYKLKKDVFAAIGADKDPNTANNGFNYQFGRWNVFINPYLNPFLAQGLAPWMLLDMKYSEEHGGAVWLDRVKLEIKSKIASNDANVWTGYARFIAGFNDWRFACAGGVNGGTQLLKG